MGGELVEPAPLISYTEKFYEAFPFYLSIGMTYDQYWNDDCMLVKYYQEAHEVQQQRQNRTLWLQGAYFYDALCAVSPVLHAFAKTGTKPQPYLKEPYPLSEQEDEIREEDKRREEVQKAKAKFEAWASSLDLPKLKGKGEDNA